MKKPTFFNVLLFLGIAIGIPYFVYKVIPMLFPPPYIELPRSKKEGTYDAEGVYFSPELDEQEMAQFEQALKTILVTNAKRLVVYLLATFLIIIFCIVLCLKNSGLLRWGFFIAACLCFIIAFLFIQGIRFDFRQSVQHGYVSSSSPREFFHFLFK